MAELDQENNIETEGVQSEVSTISEETFEKNLLE